jgi:hypothetical protein
MNALYFLLILSSLFIEFPSDHGRSLFIKGMTVSCQTWGAEWAMPEMKKTMCELRDLGINAIAIHPYA